MTDTANDALRKNLIAKFEACTYLHSARDQDGRTHVGPSFSKDDIDVVIAALRSGAPTPEPVGRKKIAALRDNFTGLTALVQYRRKDTGIEWANMAAFDSISAAESYYKRQRLDEDWPWEYRALDISEESQS